MTRKIYNRQRHVFLKLEPSSIKQFIILSSILCFFFYIQNIILMKKKNDCLETLAIGYFDERALRRKWLRTTGLKFTNLHVTFFIRR